MLVAYINFMPPPSYLQPSYFGAMDQSNYFNYAAIDSGSVYVPTNKDLAGESFDSGLDSFNLGTTLNPMQNQLQALQAKIREGASKIEFEFAGRGKGSSQASTPESYGKEEREMMRQIAKLNDIKSSTHATFNVAGLAGFNPQQRGFVRASQQEAIQEVQRAIDFAKDATTGGAIVVHTGEWNRPVAPFYDEGESGDYRFMQYEGEEDDAPLYVVDKETGQLIEGISKDKVIAAPLWHTAESWSKEVNKDFIGKPRIDINGKRYDGVIQPDDWIDQNGHYINPEDEEQLFRRIPQYDKDKVNFKTEYIDWDELEKRRKKWNEEHPDNQLATEEFYAKMQLDNQILQFKGQSLFHLQRYQSDFETWNALNEALNNYEEWYDSLPKEERWRAFIQKNPLGRVGDTIARFVETKNMSIKDAIKEALTQVELSMRHTNESSSSADARAAELMRRRENITTLEKYGLERTGEALARLAMEAMDKSKKAREMRKGTGERWEDLYIAPENWHPAQYGSHPKELLNIVLAGREKFKERLKTMKGITDEKKLQELAEKHIKTTFDIGHLNMWRNMLKQKNNESDEQFQKRFNKWVKDNLKELHEHKAIGHLHLTDNFGYNDEHLSLGQGNAPIKEFVKMMKDWGYDDFIIEPGSFNPLTIMPDAWSYLGAVNWRHKGPSFSYQHLAHSGMYAPPTYIVGAYVPSNEWTLWSGVQLE